MTGYQRKTLAMEAEYGSGEMQDAARAALDRIAELDAKVSALEKENAMYRMQVCDLLHEQAKQARASGSWPEYTGPGK